MLRCDPSRIESLVDASHHQWTYRAGVISFAAEDAPTEDQQAEVMDAFEQLAFAGLEVEQYDMLWVRHTHEDRVELHLRTPRLELTTGKSLNIAPPGYHAAYDSLRDMMNQRHGWADPLDAERLQEVRDTAKGPETGERWRLKGEIFLEDWQAAPLSETLNAELETIRSDHAASMQSQLESFRADFSAIATSALHTIKTDIQYFLSDSRSELQGRSAMIRRWLTISPWVIVGVITAWIASAMSASCLWMTLLTPPPLFRETIKAMLSDDLETSKGLLRDYVNATVGFEQLAHEMDKDPKTPMRMLSAKANPRANNFLAMVARLKQREGVSFSITPNDRLHVSRFAQPEHFWPSLFANLGFHCANDPQ